MTDHPALHIDAELVLERAGQTFRVWTADETLFINAPSLSALRSLDDFSDAIPIDSRLLDGGLSKTGLRVEIQVRRATIATVDTDEAADPLGRWLTGFDASVVPVGIVIAVIRALG